MNLDNFDWGWMENSEIGNFHKHNMYSEIFVQKVYERFFEVEKDDVVFDVGASIGPFTFSILEKKPKMVYCIEPSKDELVTLQKNLNTDKVKIINKAISHSTGNVEVLEVFDINSQNFQFEGVKFMDLVNEQKIDKIDFLKTDCEGGEYDIFNRENIWWIKNNVRKIVGEWHLHLKDVDLTQKFREFRDIYLKLFPNHQIFSVDGVDIKWDLWNEHFIEYYKHIIVYIDNRD